MEISRLDAWYSSAEGSLEGPATYIVQGLCRTCCIPEVILRCMQVIVFFGDEKFVAYMLELSLYHLFVAVLFSPMPLVYVC